MNRALDDARGKLWWKGWSDDTTVVDYFTNKSNEDPSQQDTRAPVKAHVTLDLRVAVGEDVKGVLGELQSPSPRPLPAFKPVSFCNLRLSKALEEAWVPGVSLWAAGQREIL